MPIIVESYKDFKYFVYRRLQMAMLKWEWEPGCGVMFVIAILVAYTVYYFFTTGYETSIDWHIGLASKLIKWTLYSASALFAFGVFGCWGCTMDLIDPPPKGSLSKNLLFAQKRNELYWRMLATSCLSIHLKSTLFGITACFLIATIMLVIGYHNDMGQALPVVVFFSTIGISWILLLIRPPTIFILGKSDSEAFRQFLGLHGWLSPLRVVCLLDPNKAETEYQAKFANFDCLRTRSGKKWVEVVRFLMETAPIIVIDGMDVSPLVIKELEWALTAGYAYKTILLRRSYSSQNPPALQALIDNGKLPPGVNIRPVFHTGLLSILHQLTQSLESMPKPGRPLSKKEQYFRTERI